MGSVKLLIGQFLVAAMALTTIASFIALIISAALIRLLGSLRTQMAPAKGATLNTPGFDTGASRKRNSVG